MKRRSTHAVGALHPVLFFVFIYGVSLVMAIFVCRTVYFSINDDQNSNRKLMPIASASVVDYTASN